MKAAPFVYHRVDSVADAVERLDDLGEDAKVLAGGQSLVPMMNFRLARPSALVDITRVGELRGMVRDGKTLTIGALTTHASVEHADGQLGGGYEILSRAAAWIGHMPIRSRGTFGGSLAHADPTAEWCLLAIALDATIVIGNRHGQRELAASAFLRGYFTTALEPGELVLAVRFSTPCPRAAIEEFARRKGDFAVVAAVVTLSSEGDPSIVIGGVDEVPVRARDAERIVAEAGLAAESFDEAAAAAAAEIDPGSDLHGSADYRRRLTGVLVSRALTRAVRND